MGYFIWATICTVIGYYIGHYIGQEMQSNVGMLGAIFGFGLGTIIYIWFTPDVGSSSSSSSGGGSSSSSSGSGFDFGSFDFSDGDFDFDGGD